MYLLVHHKYCITRFITHAYVMYSSARHVDVTFADLHNYMLKDKAKFPAVGIELNAWFKTHLRGGQTGVLVSHNNAVDVQFLLSEYLRADLQLPETITYALDTLAVIKRFSSIAYRKVTSSDSPWSDDPELMTKKGNPSMGVKPCAMYALSKRETPATFLEVCGEHHDAVADTRAVAVILFDKDQFGDNSLHHHVFDTTKKCFQPLEEVWDTMRAKVAEPVIKLEPLPPGWVLAPVSNTHFVYIYVNTFTRILTHTH